MKHLFTALLFSLAITAIQAQATFTVVANPLQVTTLPDDDDADAPSHVINLTSETKSIRWERTVVAITAGCNTQICDPNLCYIPSVSVQTFTLLPNDTVLFTPHLLNPEAQQCCAIIHVKLTNLNGAPSDTVQAVYLFNDCSVSTGSPLPLAQVRLFPNPTADVVHLDNAGDVARVRIFTLDSGLAATLEATRDGNYSLGQLPAGAYFMVLEDQYSRPFQLIGVVRQ